VTAGPSNGSGTRAGGGNATGPRDDNNIDMSLLPELIGYNLRCAQVAVFQHFSSSFDGTEMSPPQFGTMILIEANPGISQSAVANALRFDRSTLVQIIDRLESRSLVVREVSARDRRSHALKLTDKGLALLTELKERALAHETHIARGLSGEERRSLIRLLSCIFDVPER
jgi:DNA-binding MarR family transcriptional regulator